MAKTCCDLFSYKSIKNIYEKVKYFQNLTFYINTQIFQFCFKCIHLQNIQAIKNFLISKFITKFSTCGYDKLQGISKEPMPPTLFQDITWSMHTWKLLWFLKLSPQIGVKPLIIFNLFNTNFGYIFLL